VDLIQEYGVARLTANTALRLLVTEGLAVLSPGMVFYVGTDIGQN
jgi:DNA-binding GntR family transcriptional regulator